MNRTNLRIARPAPRNPLAVAARKRHAGRHGPGKSAQRQQAQRTLQQELDRLRRPTP